MTKMIPTLINGRWKLLLPEHRAARPEWTSEQGWEKARLNNMHEWVADFRLAHDNAPVVYYIGAEEGDMAGLLAQWGAKLVLFEPNPAVWPNIKAIWEANSLKAPVCCQAFASSKTTGDISVDQTLRWPPCADGPIIAEHGFKNLCEADGTIAEVKIDDVVLAYELPDMISLDVEGAEWEVLRGAEQTLRQHRPRIYLSGHPEFLYQIYGEYLGDLRHWIRELGYTETLLAYDHEVHLVYEETK